MISDGDSFDEFTFEINRWVDKHKQHPDKLALKLIEEVGELIGARLKGKWNDVAKEYGDVVIVLFSLAELDEIDVITSAREKLFELFQRKGKIVDGIFVKEEDL